MKFASTRNKIARSIRASPETEVFDLAGYSASSCDELVQGAFVEPMDVAEQIRITFIVGAGKLGRQKYGEDLRRHLCDSLQRAGFDDDAGAACVNTCQGKFKYQHDTGKNLLKIHVFPRLVPVAAGAAAAEASAAAETEGEHSFEQLCLECDVDMFQRFERSRAPAWLQKKRMLSFLEGNLALLNRATEKLCTMQALDAKEQRAYDSMSSELLEEKISTVSRSLKKCVKEGRVTSEEKRHLIDAAEERLAENREQVEEVSATLRYLFPDAESTPPAAPSRDGDDDDAEEALEAISTKLAVLFGDGQTRPTLDGKQHKGLLKKVAKLNGAHRNLEARVDTLRAIEPITHEIRNSAELAELAVRMAPLERADCSASKKVALPQLQANFAALAEECRPWFCTDDEWRRELQSFKKRAKKGAKRGGKKKKGGARKGGSASASSWSQSRGGGKPQRSGRSGGGGGGGAFAGLMNSDSD